TQGLLDVEKTLTAEAWVHSLEKLETGAIVGDFVFGGTHPDFPRAGGHRGWGLRVSFPHSWVSTVYADPDKGHRLYAYQRATLQRGPGKRWVHVALCNTPTQRQLYLDGVPLAGTTKMNGTVSSKPELLKPSPTNLYVGSQPHSGDVFSRLDARMRALRISSSLRYNDKFTPASSWFPDSETLVLLDFSKPQGDVIADLSGNGRHGKINGAQWVTIPQSFSPLPSTTTKTPTIVKTPTPTPSPTPAPKNRSPVPDLDAREKALAEIEEVFGKEIAAAKTSTAKAAMFRKMYQVGVNTNDNPAARYVALEMARDLAAEAGDFSDSLQAIDRLMYHFDVSGPEMWVAAFTRAAPRAASPRARYSLISKAMERANLAAKNDHVEVAVQLAAVAYSTSLRSSDVALRKKARALRDELQARSDRWAASSQALETLKTNPEDPEANVAAGIAFCLGKNDWTRGIPYFMKSSDPAVRAAAELDGASKSQGDREELVKVGDAWWDLSQAATDRQQKVFQLRARHWYGRVVSGLTGL
ncbi:MAG: LamG domain-containing protein, partial [Planctomycetales bacterium]